MDLYIPSTLFRLRKADFVFIAAYLGCKSLSRLEGLSIQSRSREASISVSGFIAVPSCVASLCLSGIVLTVEEQTPTRSISSLSHISATAGEVAAILRSSAFVTLPLSAFEFSSGC